MDTLDKSIEIIKLYDFYQDLLTEKQKSYFEDYYFEDFSLAEIAEDNNVSRNAVFDQVKRTVKKINEFESKLNLNKKYVKRRSIFIALKTESDISKIKKLLKELEKVE
ncbi:MAG: YlxM family DNA-binding protein [Candidatus Izemoplasma sp.]